MSIKRIMRQYGVNSKWNYGRRLPWCAKVRNTDQSIYKSAYNIYNIYKIYNIQNTPNTPTTRKHMTFFKKNQRLYFQIL